MAGKKRFKREILDKLPQFGQACDFYRPLKITRAALCNWVNELGMPSHMTDKQQRVIVKSEFINWLERQGRIDD